MLSISSSAQISNEVITNKQYTYKVSGFKQGSTLKWDIVGGKILSENPTQSDSIVVEWLAKGKQKLSVYEQSIYNCIGETYSINISVTDKNAEIKFNIPNSFTPNNDGINDYFTVKANREAHNYKLRIINRWGNTLFTTNKMSDKWDGKYKGKKCNASTYFYLIDYSHNGKNKKIKGFIQLMGN